MPLFAKNVEEFIHFKSDELYRIVRKYQHIDECKETCDAFYGCYKEGIALSIFAQTGLLKANDSFDLITILLSKSSGFVYKFLVSNIPLKNRFAIFKAILSPNNYSEISEFVSIDGNYRIKEYLSKKEFNKLPEKKQALLVACNNNEDRTCYVQELAAQLLKQEPNYIRVLQDYGIDFYSQNWIFFHKILN